jgi:hypothetical protein
MPDDPTLQTSAKLWDNPYVKGLVWFVGIAITIGTATLGGASAFDSRYAKADKVSEVEAMVVAQAKQSDAATKQLEKKIEYQADQNRKRSLEDTLFKINVTPDKQRTPVDNALKAKYEQEIREMNQRWNAMGMPLK